MQANKPAELSVIKGIVYMMINTRSIGLFFLQMLASVAGFGQASPHDLYVGTWKGEMNIGRAVQVEFIFERTGNVLKGFAVDPSGERKALTQVMGLASGTVFRMDRDEATFMVFTGKLGADKASLSGDVTIMEGKVERGKAPWNAKKVVGSAAAARVTAAVATSRSPAAQAAYERGLPLVRSRAFQAAAAAFTECLNIHPKDVGCLMLRGVSNNSIWNHKEALVDLNSAIALSPKPSASFYIARSEARNGLQNYDGAIADADAAFKINSIPDAYLLRGAALVKKGGKIYFDSIILSKEEQQKPVGLKLAAEGLVEINKFIELKPQDYRGYLERGMYQYQMWNVFSETRDMKPAIADLDKALSLSPQNANIYYARYLVHEALGNKESAAADLAKYNVLFKK